MAESIISNSTGARTAKRSIGERKTVWTLSDIAQLADSVRVLCTDVIGDSGADWGEENVQKLVAARDLASQIGVMADIGMRDLGDSSNCRHQDAAGWLCSPAYHAAHEEVNHG